jgi:hypothetical protein
MMRILIAAAIFTMSLVCFGQGVVPSDLQAAIFYKVLAYDYNLQTMSDDEITIVIVIDAKTHGKKGELENAFKKIAGQELGGKKLKIAVIEIKNPSEIDAKITEVGGDIIYVATGTAEGTVSQVLQIASQKKHATLCGDEKLTEKGFAIGLTVEGGKPKIVINLPASQAQGMKLSSKVLRLAKVIK